MHRPSSRAGVRRVLTLAPGNAVWHSGDRATPADQSDTLPTLEHCQSRVPAQALWPCQHVSKRESQLPPGGLSLSSPCLRPPLLGASNEHLRSREPAGGNPSSPGKQEAQRWTFSTQ